MLPSIDITIVDGIPVTTPARTLIDLAAKESPRIVEEALDDALRRGLVSRVRLRWRIDELGRRGRPGIDVIRSLVAARTPGTSVPQSVFETRLLRLLREAGLPAPALQHEVKTAGRLLAVVDFAFPDLRLAVEADGYRWHSGRASWEHDRARRNALTSAGWKVVHVTWNDLNHRAPETVAGIKAAIVRSAEEHGGMGSLRC
jgi:very-short-patch-repair endonuclease